MSYLEIVTSNGEAVEGYFRGFNRNTNSLSVSSHISGEEVRGSIGLKTLRSLRKYAIDRFGNKFEISREKRTWRGEVCT